MEKLAIKVVELLSEGVGALTRPWITRRDANAKAMADADTKRIERLAQEQLRQHLRDIRAGRLKIGMDLALLPAGEIEGDDDANQMVLVKQAYINSLQKLGYSPQQSVEIERRINLDQIAAIAVDEAFESPEGSSSVDGNSVDPDWFAQWRNRAQDVSNEDMQRLWARVLNEEARRSGAFSIHTMEFLSRMSRSDAELIAILGRFVLNGRHIHSGESKTMTNAGIGLDQLLYLSDLGIISDVTGLSTLTHSMRFIAQPGGKMAGVRCNDKALFFTPKADDQETIDISVYAISIIGRELLSLASCKADQAYLKELADAVRNNCGKVFLANVVSGAGSDFRAKRIGEI